jgi:hypothetical protein
MRRPSPAFILALIALFVALGGAGMAATGGDLILGKANSATSTTSLSAPVAGKALQVSNTSTNAGATPLGLTAAPGHAPFTVNTSTKVANLNADTLDGKDSAYFLPGTTVRRLGPVQLSNGGGATDLLTISQLTFVGECFYDSDFNEEIARLDLKTSVAGSAYADLTTSGNTNSSAAMNAGGQVYPLGGQSAISGTQTFTPVTGEALSQNGQELFYDLYVGENVAGATGNDCTFGGSIVVK